mmetsp:Transcript_39671/g.119180  ORF Transcript_39671/g.119180 Transcript_39671/m.119180 type:complete len:252 (+) Transcript_39671:1029-1784(+)
MIRREGRRPSQQIFHPRQYQLSGIGGEGKGRPRAGEETARDGRPVSDLVYLRHVGVRLLGRFPTRPGLPRRSASAAAEAVVVVLRRGGVIQKGLEGLPLDQLRAEGGRAGRRRQTVPQSRARSSFATAAAEMVVLVLSGQVVPPQQALPALGPLLPHVVHGGPSPATLLGPQGIERRDDDAGVILRPVRVHGEVGFRPPLPAGGRGGIGGGAPEGGRRRRRRRRRRPGVKGGFLLRLERKGTDRFGPRLRL